MNALIMHDTGNTTAKTPVAIDRQLSKIADNTWVILTIFGDFGEIVDEITGTADQVRAEFLDNYHLPAYTALLEQPSPPGAPDALT